VGRRDDGHAGRQEAGQGALPDHRKQDGIADKGQQQARREDRTPASAVQGDRHQQPGEEGIVDSRDASVGGNAAGEGMDCQPGRQRRQRHQAQQRPLAPKRQPTQHRKRTPVARRVQRAVVHEVARYQPPPLPAGDGGAVQLRQRTEHLA